MSFAKLLLEALQKDLPLIYPQLVLMVAATLMLWPGDLFLPRHAKGRWSSVTLVVIAIATLFTVYTPTASGFSQMYRVDGVTRGFQLLTLVSGFLTVLLSQPQLDALREQTVEYYALILFSLAGMGFLVGATDLISMYLGLELMALCIYILVGYFRDQERSVEAGIKYFLLGAFSSGILIYGIALLFAAAGGVTTNLERLGQAIATAPVNHNLLVFTGVLMLLVGFAFKVAAVPFHMWSPDAYEGAPTPVTAFMSMAPKAAALAAFIRIFGQGLAGVRSDWVAPLSFIAAASMVVGNVAAMRQHSLKRMLAFSSIAHVGYMLLGVLSADPHGGLQAVWLYMLTYVVMQTGAFGILIVLQGRGIGERIDDFRGLGRRHPVLAFAMMVFMLSLAGIPPLVGFFSKFVLFKLAIDQGFYTLTVVALLTSAVGAYYYLNVVKHMYFMEPADESQPKLPANFGFIIGAACAVILVGTFFANHLVKWMDQINWI